MSFHFEFDERALLREVERQAQPAMDRIADDLTQELDQFRLRFAGRPTAEIRTELQKLFERAGGKMTDPELAEYAAAIAAGTHIRIEAERLHL